MAGPRGAGAARDGDAGARQARRARGVDAADVFLRAEGDAGTALLLERETAPRTRAGREDRQRGEDDGRVREGAGSGGGGRNGVALFADDAGRSVAVQRPELPGGVAGGAAGAAGGRGRGRAEAGEVNGAVTGCRRTT